MADESVIARLQAMGKEPPRVRLEGEAEAEAEAEPPTSDRYQALEEIGRGGMGIILKGRDTDLGREVAMKVIRPEHADAPDIVQRFVEEAQIEGQLQHPGIVPVYELGLQDDARAYFTMKLIRGETLGALLEQREDPGEDRPRFLRVFEQICEAVAYAHTRGVVHRDLKPANVMVGSFGEVQVVDWGFAKVLGRSGETEPEGEVRTIRSGPDASESVSGSVLGTPAYMPPEQARGEIEQVDERSDVFALGGILCEILTGAPPYTGTGRDVLLRAVRADLDETLRRLDAAGADDELVALAKRCLAPAMDDRPADADAVAKAIGGHLAGLAERARQAQLQAARAEVRARGEKKARRLTLALAAAVLVALGGFVLAERDKARRRERAAEAVSETLAAAADLRGVARAAKADLEKWGAARAAAERAVEIAKTGGADASVLTRAEAFLADVDRERHRAEQNARLLAALDEIRMRRGDTLDLAETDRAYGRALAAFPLEEDPAAAARAIRETGISEPVAAALDEWIWVRSVAMLSCDSLVATAKAADPNPWRDALRDAVAARDRDAIRVAATNVEPEVLEGNTPSLLALHLGTSGEHDLAERILREAQRERPDDFWLNYLLGYELTLLVPPRWEEAIGFYRVALASRPESVEVRHQLGIALFKIRAYDEALAVWEDALLHSPEEIHLYDHVIEAHEDQGRLEELIQTWAEAAQVGGEDWIVHYRLARARWLISDWEGSIQALEQACVLEPDSVFLHVMRGQTYLLVRDAEGARAAHEHALALDPESGEAWNGIAHVLLYEGREKDSIQSNLEALARRPYDPAIMQELAYQYSEEGDPERALEFCGRALRVKPEYAPAHAAIAGAHLQHHDYRAALAALEGIERIPERLAEGRFSKGFLTVSDLDGSGAKRIPFLTKMVPKAHAYQMLGLTHEQMGDLAAAVEAFEEQSRLHPDLWIPHGKLCFICPRLGRLEACLAHCDQVVATGGDEGYVSWWRVYVNLFLGRIEEARRQMRIFGEQRLWQDGSFGGGWAAACEVLLRRAPELQEILDGDPDGDVEWTSAWEQAVCARIFQECGRHVTAARLYREALEREPDLAGEHLPYFRIWHVCGGAAQPALMASHGWGPEGERLTEAERRAWRDRALAWMREDLALWRARVEDGDPAYVAQASRMLDEFHNDSLYAPVMAAQNRERLPREEAQAWEAFWAAVRAWR